MLEFLPQDKYTAVVLMPEVLQGCPSPKVLQRDKISAGVYQSCPFQEVLHLDRISSAAPLHIEKTPAGVHHGCPSREVF